MATMNAPANERRHIPERRVNGSALAANALSVIDWIAMILMIVGGLVWGMVGIFEVNPVNIALGEQAPLARLVYALVGLASLYGIYLVAKLAQRSLP